MQSKVSIVIPCFNYGHFLVESLLSVQNQSYVDFECIIVDDGSTDNTKKVAKHYVNSDSRFAYYYQPNRGLSEARNYGIRQAKGDFIQFLDADDKISIDKIARQLDFLNSNSDVDIVISDAIFFTKENRWNFTSKFEIGLVENPIPLLVRDNCMVVSAALVRTRAVTNCGFFDPNLNSLEDWDYWIRMIHSGSKMWYGGPQLGYTLIRVHESSMKTNDFRMRLNELRIRIKHESLLPITENEKLIADTLKSLAYLIVQFQRQEAKKSIDQIFLELKDIRLSILKMFTWLPSQFKRRFVWLLFGDWKFYFQNR